MKIFKYQIPIQETFNLELPIHSNILSFQVQNNEAFIWVMISEDKRLMCRYFTLLGTGQEIEYHPNIMKYIGTIQLKSFVWHLFEDLIG